MAQAEANWQAARLIPVSGLSGPDEQERRGASAYLAVLASVREFGRALTTRFGAPAGRIETFIEVEFPHGEKRCRPDGLIRVTRGTKVWVALVEVKTARVPLDDAQVEMYVEVARAQGFDAVLTISNQITTVPGVHPVSVRKSKLNKVSLHHLSWSQIHTEALIARVNEAVSDPDQAWILAEYIRYLEYPKSGAVDFEDMGPSWVTVRNAAVTETLRASDKEAALVVARYDQLIAFAGMRLARQLGVDVRPLLSRAELNDPASRWQAQAADLASTGKLSGSLQVPNTVGPMETIADLRAGRVSCSITVNAPSDGRPLTRLNWLLRQLKQAPRDLLIEAVVSRSRTGGRTLSLGELLDSPKSLLDGARPDLRSFRVTLNRPAGTKRGQGRGSFVGSVLSVVDEFYASVVQQVKPWASPPPKVKAADEPLTDRDASRALQSSGTNTQMTEAALPSDEQEPIVTSG